MNETTVHGVSAVMDVTPVRLEGHLLELWNQGHQVDKRLVMSHDTVRKLFPMDPDFIVNKVQFDTCKCEVVLNDDVGAGTVLVGWSYKRPKVDEEQQ